MTTHNKVAIVTGAGTGIGKAVTLALLHDGYRVALAGRRREPLEQTAGQSGEPARALVVPTDVSDAGSVQALFARVKERFGRMGISSLTTPAFSFPAWRSMNSASSSGKRWWTST
jgi:NAD(P)-dependent dehydrogenase (short-subunit alcohol dehydrogenase family)